MNEYLSKVLVAVGKNLPDIGMLNGTAFSIENGVLLVDGEPFAERHIATHGWALAKLLNPELDLEILLAAQIETSLALCRRRHAIIRESN